MKRILWAVNPFETPDELLKNAATALRRLVAATHAVVEPVYVMSPAQLNLSLEFQAPLLDRYVPMAGEALSHVLQSVGVPGLLPAHVISDSFNSTAQAVHALSDYAREKGADLIVSGTHGRSGFKRVFLGSFTETLLLRSAVPVLVISPHMDRHTSKKTILLPTDFSETAESERILQRVTKLARDLNSKLTLFHVIPHPVEPVLQSGIYMLGGTWVPVQDYFNEEIENRRRRGEIWGSWAEKQGVALDVRIDASPGSIADKIIEISDKIGAWMITMQSESGPIASALVGSITRQVLRHATCPVWTFRGRIAKDESKGRAA